MDKVRFGRALGVGAREAAKALVKAADAAVAADPRAAAPQSQPAAARPEVARPAARVAQTVTSVRATGAGVKRGGRRFGEAVWAPLAKVSGVLWLEVTGVLFGMFAVVAGIAVWRERGDLRGSGAPMQHAWFAVAMLLVFGYFTVSSYVRAARRGRR